MNNKTAALALIAALFGTVVAGGAYAATMAVHHAVSGKHIGVNASTGAIVALPPENAKEGRDGANETSDGDGESPSR